MNKNSAQLKIALVFSLTVLVSGSLCSMNSLAQEQGQEEKVEENKQGTAQVGVAEINDEDELNITIAGELFSYSFSNMAIVNAKGEEISADSAKGIFSNPTPVVFVENPEKLPKIGEVFAANAIVIYYPLAAYNTAKQVTEEEEEKASKFNAYITMVYADESTKLSGLTEVLAMKINGKEVMNNEATVDGHLIQFSRKHTKSEVHVFGLQPGIYEVEFVAEATFGGKYYKKNTGTGKIEVKDRDATGKVVFGADK